MSKIPENILKILEQCRVDGNTLYLPEGQLDRPVYQAVNKVLENIGGKWDRKAKGHVFADDDPADLLDAVLLTGETVDLKKQFQFFPTPRPVAEKMCKLAELDDTCVVLEPSCGKGDLADVIYEAGVKELVGIELNPDMKKYLEGKPYTTLTGLDFLEFVNDPNIRTPWTRIVMNPPFSRQQDIDHILAAYNILAPGGILVSIVSESPFFRENKKSVDFRATLEECGAEIIPLEAGDFKESGTMVQTRIIKVRKEGQPIQLPEPDIEQEPAHAEKAPEQTPQARKLVNIPIIKLHHHPDNPRKNLGDVTELAESIKAKGVLQNLTVVPWNNAHAPGAVIGDGYDDDFAVVIGNRRLEAGILADVDTLPCVVSDMTYQEQISTMLVENMQRADLTVYEQAQGFQMMLDLGATVEEISKKSGFSQTTVRRRVKMMELDQEKLKEVSSRQLALGDFDQLAEIEDLKLRNKVLEDIGTAEFNSSLAKAKIAEETARRLPEVKKWLKDHGAKKISRQESYGSKYETFYVNGHFCSYIRIHLLGERGNTLPNDKDIGDTKLFYVLDDGSLSLYMERKKPQREKKSQEQKDRERAQRQAKKEVKELSSLHYTLRKEFVDKLTVSKKNKEAVLLGALNFALYSGHSHGSNHADAVTERLGLSNYEYNTDPILEAIFGLPEKDLAKAVYDLYSDSPENWFAGSMESPGYFPGYSNNHNTSLTLLYKWLISLGYEMSADEKALMDGTHEIYRRKEQA